MGLGFRLVRRFGGVTLLAIVALGVPARAGTTADATWAIHREPLCGLELRYPPGYRLEASGPRDWCEPWMSIGVPEGRRMREVFRLQVRQGDHSRSSPRDFAIEVATAECASDGPEGSTYCVDASVRSTFRTAQGFRGFEIQLTEVRESAAEKSSARRRRGPIFALDLSDDQEVRLLMSSGEPARTGELRAILDTVRIWTRARPSLPKVVEIRPYLAAPRAFALSVTTGEEYRSSRPDPTPVTSWLLTDPRGRKLGRDAPGAPWNGEVPAVTHSTAVESGAMLRESPEGRYELRVAASAPAVPYRISVAAPDRGGRSVSTWYAGRTAEPGAVDRYAIVYAPGAASPVTIAEVHDAPAFDVLVWSREDAVHAFRLSGPRGGHEELDPRRGASLHVRQPVDGAYALEVIGGGAGSYTLDVRGWDGTGTAVARPEVRNVPTAPGVVHVYRLEYAATARVPVTLSARFEGDRLLAWVNPAHAETRLAPATRVFPLVVFYGRRIQPVTFSAMLNGDNMSGRFTPEPGTHETVPLPIGPGLNTLEMSVEGTAEDGRPIRDAQRLLLRVE